MGREGEGRSLRHAGAPDARGAHLGKHLVEPLQRAVEVQLDPAGGAGDRLTPVLCSPAFDEAHADGTHSGELVHRLKALVHRLGQQCRKLLIVEDFQVTAWGDFADCGRVPAITLVTVWTLDKDRAVTKTLSKHFSADVVQPYAPTDVSAS